MDREQKRAQPEPLEYEGERVYWLFGADVPLPPRPWVPPAPRAHPTQFLALSRDGRLAWLWPLGC